MSFTQPRTWTVGELVTKAMLDEQIRDNIAFLAAPSNDVDTLNLGADPTFASTSFINIDGTNYKATITIPPGFSRVALNLAVVWAHNTLANVVFFDVLNSATGARVAGDDGMTAQSCVVANAKMLTYIRYYLDGLTPGNTYTFTPQIKNTANTTTVFAGAGTANGDVHTQFYVELA